MKKPTKNQIIALIIIAIGLIAAIGFLITSFSTEETDSTTETTIEETTEVEVTETETETIEVAQAEINSSTQTSNAIRINWNAATNADGYRVYMLVDDEFEKLATIQDSETLTYRVSELDSDTEYTFAVKAFTRDENGTAVFGEMSETYSVSTDEVEETTTEVTTTTEPTTVVTTTAATTTTQKATTTTSATTTTQKATTTTAATTHVTSTTAAATTTTKATTTTQKATTTAATTTSSTVSAFVEARREAGCTICGSKTCPSLYATNQWGDACVDGSLCPEYASTLYCSVCGKLEGDGSNNTCRQCIMDTTCPLCGELVIANTCHTCS
ncbi:MAG: fibronectin type III domain-containing protein [Clostridia bacterium]